MELSLRGFFSFSISSEETFGEETPGPEFMTLHDGDKNSPFIKHKGAPRTYVTAGPTSEGGGGSVAARRRPKPRACLSAQPRRPTRASG